MDQKSKNLNKVCNTYLYYVYDVDIGAMVFDKKLNYSQVLEQLNNDIAFYDGSEDLELFPDDQQLKEDLKYWDPKSIIWDFAHIDFYNGLVEYKLWLPGRHRYIGIKVIKDS